MNNVKGRFYPQIAPKGCYPQDGQVQAVIFQRDILQAMFGFKIQFSFLKGCCTKNTAFRTYAKINATLPGW